MVNVIYEIIWVVSLLTEHDVKLSTIPIIWRDNTWYVALTKNPIQNSKMKHVELELCFLREKVKNGHVNVKYVPSLDQIAYILTEAVIEKGIFAFQENAWGDVIQ